MLGYVAESSRVDSNFLKFIEPTHTHRLAKWDLFGPDLALNLQVHTLDMQARNWLQMLAPGARPIPTPTALIASIQPQAYLQFRNG